MGGGSYKYASRMERATVSGMMTNSLTDNFRQKAVSHEMKSVGLDYRESRDSDEHPNSVAIIVGLDVTASMGAVPDHLIKHGLPTMMDAIIKRGTLDPQILFMGIGDHECDRSPLQAGQFESSDELLDKWLQNTWLEGGGGGNRGESYMLAWYFAANHTKIDCLEKRKEKGFLFTIGDEPVLDSVPGPVLKKIMGSEGQYGTMYTSVELLAEASKMYEVYHIHTTETHSGARKEVQDGWKQMMGDHCIIVQNSDHISSAIAEIVSGAKKVEDTPDVESSEPKTEEIL